MLTLPLDVDMAPVEGLTEDDVSPANRATTNWRSAVCPNAPNPHANRTARRPPPIAVAQPLLESMTSPTARQTVPGRAYFGQAPPAVSTSQMFHSVGVESRPGLPFPRLEPLPLHMGPTVMLPATPLLTACSPMSRGTPLGSPMGMMSPSASWPIMSPSFAH